MSLLLMIESLKIHKLQHEKKIQVWFVVLYALNIAPYVMPFADRNFDTFYAATQRMMEDMSTGAVPDETIWQYLSTGNIALMAMVLVASLITLFFGLVYASLIVAEKRKQGPDLAMKKSLSALPKLLALAALLIIPAMFSAFLAFIPLLIFLLMIYFLPLYLAFTDKTLGDAMRHSIRATQGHKLRLFFLLFFLSLLITLPQNIILGFMNPGDISYLLINTFFRVFMTFAQARLMGMMYLLLVKKETNVIPSKFDKTT